MDGLQVSDRWKELYQTTNWVELLKKTAEQYPDNVALVIENQRITYKNYWDKVVAYAKGLYAVGVRKNTHVAIWMTNRPEWCFARHAIYKLGAVMVSVNTRYGEDDLTYVLEQSDTEYLILESMFLGKTDAVKMLKQVCPELDASEPGKVNSQKLPKLKSVIVVDGKSNGCYSMNEIIDKGKEVLEKETDVTKKPEEMIHLIYTSGTPGFPKGVMTPSSCNLAYCICSSELFHFYPGARYFSPIPFLGNIGLWGMSVSLYTGATLFATSRFDPVQTLEIIQQEKITHAFLVPTTLIDVLRHPDFDKYDLSSLEYVAAAGAPVPLTIIRQFKEKTGVSIMNCYGLAEASGLSTWVPDGDTPEHIEKSLGLPLPHCRLAIIDPGTGEFMPPGKEGEISTKEALPGSQHMIGYYKKPDITAETIKDGWLHSGDLGCVDEDGYVYLTGRVKEMFIVGGFNVAPAEVENFLLKHPAIKAVAVVGVPDERLGEVGAAFIILRKGETATPEEIIDYCKGKIANIKIPRYVYFVDEFPLNPQGKIQKFKLKEMVA